MKPLLFGLALLAGLGCAGKGLQPIGPLAKKMTKDQPPAAAEKVEKPEPAVASAPRPVPPAKLIEPEEVSADNPTLAAQKLLNEFDADRRSMPAAPRTAEVSQYKGGVKVK